MPITGISLPDVFGFGKLRPIIEYKQDYTLDTGYFNLECNPCPDGKLWCVSYISVGSIEGTISDTSITIKDKDNNTVAIVSMVDSLAKNTTKDVFGLFLLTAGQKITVQFNVTQAMAICWLTISGCEFNYGG